MAEKRKALQMGAEHIKAKWMEADNAEIAII